MIKIDEVGLIKRNLSTFLMKILMVIKIRT